MDDPKNNPKNEEKNDLTRRDFVALSIAAGVAAAAGDALVSAAEMPVDVMDVDVKTPDGVCDATFVHPKTGSHPGVIIWPDAFGRRASMVDMAKRIAADGYSVLVPNPYYRLTKAPGIDMSNFSFSNQADMGKLRPLMGSIGAPGAAEKDAVAFVAFLDAQKQVNTSKKIGTQGYCMGGPPIVPYGSPRCWIKGPRRRIVPRRRGLVSDQPTSPHLLIPERCKGRLYVAIAGERRSASAWTRRTS